MSHPTNAARAFVTLLLLGATAVRADTPLELARRMVEADARDDDATVIELGRELVALAPAAPSVRLRLAAALMRSGDAYGAREQLEAVADMGAAAGPDELEEFDGFRFRDPRRRLRANAAPVEKSKVEFELEERDLLPESLALDASDGSWYVGSLRHRKIVRRSADGGVIDWIESGRDGLGSVLGIKIDPVRGELWAASCNDPGGSPAISPPDDETLGRGALFRYRLPGGELLSVHPAGERESPVCFNDLAIGADGTVYATGTGGVWRLAAQTSTVELWHPSDGFLNGIALSADGATLYVADHLLGVLRIDTASGAETRVAHPASTTLAGVDGLYVQKNYLVAVQNGFRSGPARVIQAFLAPDGANVTCVNLLERNHASYSVPTTGALVDGSLVYVATSQLDRLDAQGEPAPAEDLVSNVFLRVPILATCTPERRERTDADYDPCADRSLTVGDGGIEAARRRLYETSCAAALWFDGLFGEQRHIASAQNTSGRVEVAALGSEFEGAKLKTRFHVRMKFPNLEERVEAFFGRDESDDFLRDRNEGLALRSQFSQLEDEDEWIAGLGYSLPGSYEQKADFRIGGRGGRQPKIFTQGRYRRNIALGDSALLRFRQTGFWNNRDGFGATTSLDFDRVIGDNRLFRWGSAGTITQETDGVDWRSALVLYRNLGELRAIAWEAFVRGETQHEVPLREYGARAIYRRPFFGKSYLFGEVVAGYSWPREEVEKEREGSATLGFGVELLFGRDPY